MSKYWARAAANSGQLVVFALVLVTLVPPEVSIPVTIPVVVVLNPPAIALPVSSVVVAALVSWTYPTCTAVWRTSPISAMPLVMVSSWIPVAIDPYEVWTWPRRGNPNNGRRRRTDSHSYRDLSARWKSKKKPRSRSACELLFAGESQTDNERRSGVQFRADGNRSFARVDDSFDDGKAKSGSGDRPDFLSPEKRFEYM